MKPPRRARKAPVRSVALALAAAAWAHADDIDNRYAAHSDAELTQVAGQWPALDKEARRDFFIEVRRRMGENGAVQTIPVRGERRFGRVIRRPDGSVVRIERIIRFNARASNAAPVEYGTGFEQRVAEGLADKQRATDAPDAAPRSIKLRLSPAKASGKPSDR